MIETYTIVSTHDQNASDADTVNDCVNSDLDILITELKTSAQSLEQGSEELSLTSTTILVAETLRREMAILLPTASVHFQSGCAPPNSLTMSSHRLFKKLEEALGSHLILACICAYTHIKYGTIIIVSQWR